MYKSIAQFIGFIAAVVLFVLPAGVSAQAILGKNISIHVRDQSLGKVLKTIEDQGNFHFSYNSDQINTDSLVSLNADNLPIDNILNTLLKNRFEIKESNHFIILRYAPAHLVMVAEKTAINDTGYSIRGYIVDEQSSKKLSGVQVYAWALLQSTQSNNEGYFELNLKSDDNPLILTASKKFYKDTTVVFLNDISVTGKPRSGLFNYAALNASMHMSGNYPGSFSRSAYFLAKQADRRTNKSRVRFEPASIPKTDITSIMADQAVNALLPNTFGGYNAGTAVKIGHGLKIWTSVFNNTR